MASFRRIFPSFKWTDAWLVNQIVNLPVTIGREKIGFANGVPPETVKSSDYAIARWIQNSMDGCSCLVVFVGEETYLSPWVKYEMELAEEYKMGRIMIDLTGMKRKDGSVCREGTDPFAWHGLHRGLLDPDYYEIKRYSWLPSGRFWIGKWLEDAYQRAAYLR